MKKAGFPFFANAPVKALALALLLVAAVSFAADKSAKAPSEGPDWIPLDDPKLQEVLAKSEAAGAYDVPASTSRRTTTTRTPSVDVEPFGGTKPFKENFLSQLPTGGRAARSRSPRTSSR